MHIHLQTQGLSAVVVWLMLTNLPEITQWAAAKQGKAGLFPHPPSSNYTGVSQTGSPW